MANVKRLQYLIDQTLRVCHMLDLNSVVIKTLMKEFGETLGGDSPWIPNRSAAFVDETRSVLDEDQIHYRNASSLYVRATSISQHVSQAHRFSLKCYTYSSQGEQRIHENDEQLDDKREQSTSRLVSEGRQRSSIDESHHDSGTGLCPCFFCSSKEPPFLALLLHHPHS